MACSLVTPLAGAQAAAEPAADASWILARLARPAPMRTGFVEVRDSALLKAPLRIAGLYIRPDAATLVRAVQSPYRETTTIRAGEATIARAGKSPRRFALSRAPELAALQASFGALLAGDYAALSRDWRIATSGPRQRWRMTLQPRDPAAVGALREVVLHGRGAELRCIESRLAKGEVQRTLLASAARDAGADLGGDALARLCRQDASTP